MVFLWEGVALALACSADSFAAGFAYGGKGIRIPWISGLLLSFICTVFLGIPLLLGGIISRFIPNWLTVAVCFAILFFLGAAKLLDGIIKPKEGNADRNGDKTISPAEAALLAMALSLDGLAVGFGAGVGQADARAAVIASFIIGTAAVMGGAKLGARLSLSFNMSWISGVILIGLAVLRLIAF